MSNLYRVAKLFAISAASSLCGCVGSSDTSPTPGAGAASGALDTGPPDASNANAESDSSTVDGPDANGTAANGTAANGTAANGADADDADADDADANGTYANGTDAGDAATMSCHGRADLCDRPYNQVAQVCTHNAMSSMSYGFVIPKPNQARSFTEQLDDGVRCLMLDTFKWRSDAYLCHGECGFWGSLRLVDGLTEIAAWMDANPTEVVTFILESKIDESDTFSALVDSGLAHASGAPTDADVLYYHGAPPGTPWPTLREMVDGKQRLVVFTDDGEANGDWHLDWRAYGWETPYNDQTFACRDNRGDPKANDNQVFILNHFTLSSVGGSEKLSKRNNAFDVLWDHAARCWRLDAQYNPWRQIPTFVTVDHYHVPTSGGGAATADPFDVVEALNDAYPDPPVLHGWRIGDSATTEER